MVEMDPSPELLAPGLMRRWALAFLGQDSVWSNLMSSPFQILIDDDLLIGCLLTLALPPMPFDDCSVDRWFACWRFALPMSFGSKRLSSEEVRGEVLNK